MAIDEGPRRLALFLGMLGAMCGAFVSYRESKVIIQHNTFERLINSDFVHQEAIRYLSDVRQKRSEYFEIQKECGPQKLADSKNLKSTLSINQLAGQCASKQTDIVYDLGNIDRLHSEINTGGIEQIYWTPNYAVESVSDGLRRPRSLEVELIVTTNGGIYGPNNPPSTWTYLLILIAPIVGFLALWGSVHSIAWVRIGFSKNQ